MENNSFKKPIWQGFDCGKCYVDSLPLVSYNNVKKKGTKYIL